MFRIHYASHSVETDDHGVGVFGDYFANYEEFVDAYRQAVNDTYHGKVVLGVEDEKGKVMVTAQQLHEAAEQGREALGASSTKRDRQGYMAELKVPSKGKAVKKRG